MVHILYADSHYEGAHRDWIDSFSSRTQHQITKLVMPGGDWRWRLHGGAIHLANQFLAQRDSLPPVDAVLINGMVNAPLFLAITRAYLPNVPIGVYFQENQLTYPPPPREKLLWQDGFVNVMSAYVADWVGFNGAYLKHDFLTSLADFVAARKDFPVDIVPRISERAAVLPRGISLQERFGAPTEHPVPTQPLTFLWNHRWAYEKGVEDFAAALRQLHAENIPFQVILAGDTWDHAALKDELMRELGERVILHGLFSGSDYVDALRKADVIVACSQNEPLGVSVLEALYTGCFPVLTALGSFPTLLPPEHHDLLYDGSVEALTNRLRWLALHPEQAHRSSLSQIAAAYDWSQLIGIYDETFSRLARNF